MTFCAGICGVSPFAFVKNHGEGLSRTGSGGSGTRPIGQHWHVRALRAIVFCANTTFPASAIDNWGFCNYTILYILTQSADFGGNTTNGIQMECDNSKAVRRHAPPRLHLAAGGLRVNSGQTLSRHLYVRRAQRVLRRGRFFL